MDMTNVKSESPETVNYVTPQGLAKLKAELEYFKTDKREEVARKLHDIEGDVEESDYLLALDERAFVEGRIRQIEILLGNVIIIEPHQHSNGIINLGSTVMIREENQDAETYTIVGAAEADPKDGHISNESPLCKITQATSFISTSCLNF